MNRLERWRFCESRPRPALSWALVLALMLGAFSAAAETSAPTPLAEVDGDPITAEELERSLGGKLNKLQEQIYELKRRELDTLIAQRLLAKEAAKRGVSVAALLDAEVTAKVGLVTEQEVERFYHANKARLRGDEADVRERVRAMLQQQKLTARRAEFVESLRAQASVVVRLEPPPVVRAEVLIDGAPVRGSPDAQVTLVEFSDYHCPFCKRAQGTVKQILERYPGKIRHVFRDFPIESLHPQAPRAAEAARCAHDQGKFWEYHDLLFANAPRAASDDLRRYADQVGLNMPKFEQCVATGRHREAVQRDIDEAARLGLTGTPGFFINGRPLHGAQPLEVFARVIEEELSRSEKP
jgi:protein-disulfide isomerase